MRYFKLSSVGSLDGQQGVAFETFAHVDVGDVQQLVVVDVVGHVANALLDPLKRVEHVRLVKILFKNLKGCFFANSARILLVQPQAAQLGIHFNKEISSIAPP